MGLDPDDARKYRKYSLGMKQRLGLAAAVMERPEVLVLDEPANALDDIWHLAEGHLDGHEVLRPLPQHAVPNTEEGSHDAA